MSDALLSVTQATKFLWRAKLNKLLYADVAYRHHARRHFERQ